MQHGRIIWSGFQQSFMGMCYILKMQVFLVHPFSAENDKNSN
jgi:hypothetical protein